MSTSDLSRYEALADHAEHELELAGRGDVQGLVALAPRWDELVAGLPDVPPREAAEVLARAQLIHERTHIDLLRMRRLLLDEISQAGRARQAAAGYAAGAPAARGLERSA